MKFLKSRFILLALIPVFALQLQAQDYENYISCQVDGKEYHAKAQRLKLPFKNVDYLAIAAFKVNPDVQVWIRIFSFKDQLQPGTYQVVSEEYFNKSAKKKKDVDPVMVLIDYTEETTKLGHGFHDGESMSGTITIESVSPTSVSGTFDVILKGVYYKKKALAAMSGSGIQSNIERKILTQAGAGMAVHGDPHYHPNTKQEKKTDTIILSNGRFHLDWTKATD
ncbi:MAG: hypothetical protein IH597_05815 [Bacteroidales bacterium]|nr:hypothetical protein [Bacteroidales bacterium]